jgi:hypothetical protein
VIREDPARRGLLYAGTETGLYVSFDDGLHWDPCTGNFPVVPVYDMTIKGVEMVVATHGRSFWILDDLTPLHQLTDEIAGAAYHLFVPRQTVRLRQLLRRFADEPRRGMVNYTRADASMVSYMPVNGQRHFLDAGSNPPAGVLIQSYFRDQPEGEVRLEVLDADAHTVLRTFSSIDEPGRPRLPAESGANRFVWNMRLAGAPRVADESLDPWHRDDGPMVLSGTYHVRLSVGGQSQVQPCTIVPDPRLSATPDDLRAQFDLLQAILEKIGTANLLLNRLTTLENQVTAWEQWTADHPQANELQAASESLKAELAALKERLIDVHYPDAQLHASGLQEKLNAVFEFVDSADYAPPRQGREAFDDLSARLDAALASFERQVRPKVAALNEAIHQAGIPPLADAFW